MDQFKEVALPELAGGLNAREPEYSILDNQSPDMLNLWYKDKALTKRPGQSLYTSLANVYKVSDEFNSYRIIHAGTNLYKWNGTATKITTAALENGVANSAGVFIEFGSYMYYIDGVKLWRVASDFTVTEIVPYTPKVLINTEPTGAGTDNESYNLIGAGFTTWFSGNASATVYTLPQTALDATTVTVTISEVAKTEGTHFTVNRTAGTINFAAGTSPHGAPATGTNNVIITAYKTVSGNKAKIAKCKYGTPYGGESAGVFGGTRVFLMGNADYPFRYWRSDLSTNGGMTYWPDTSEELLDQNSEKITGCEKMGGALIIFKEDSMFAVGYSFDGEDVFYPVREIHSSMGSDAPGSIQLVDNKLVFFNSKSGIHIMTDYRNDSESTVKPLSANINSLLLKESNLTTAVSVDFDQCYWLCVNGYAYVWDYGSTPYYNMADYDKAQRRLAWYRFDGISPTCMFSDTELYYGKSTGVVKFISSKNDFGEAIRSHWKSKAYDLGAPDDLKLFQAIYPSFAPDGSPYAVVTVINEDPEQSKSETFDILNFDLSSFSLDSFTLSRIKFAQTYRMKIRIKKRAFIQILVEANALNRGVGLSGLKFTYMPIMKTKKRS